MNTNFKNLHFPTICVDGFFENPDDVRNYALSLDYKKSEDGAWPGLRTDFLHIISPDLFYDFSRKLFSIFFNFDKEEVKWELNVKFQIIEAYSQHEYHPKNLGWIHRDTPFLYSGVVFLNPDPNPNSGTTLFQQIKELKYNDACKREFYKHGNDSKNTYEESLKNNNDCFIETISFKNVYNRLIGFDGNTPHAANTFFTNGSSRLTLVYFIQNLWCDGAPLTRFNNVKRR
jgi:hypothetical protein